MDLGCRPWFRAASGSMHGSGEGLRVWVWGLGFRVSGILKSPGMFFMGPYDEASLFGIFVRAPQFLKLH